MKRWMGVKWVGLWHFAELMFFDIHWSLFPVSFFAVHFVGFPLDQGREHSDYFLSDVLLLWQLNISVLYKCLFNELHYYSGCLASIRHIVRWMRNVTFWKVQVQDPRVLMSVAECVYCGGIRCAGKSLSGANVAAEHWDRNQLSILCERTLWNKTINWFVIFCAKY